MGPHFPKWLRTQESIALLDTIPDWFWDKYLNFVYFNISHNQIKGNLPNFSLSSRFIFATVDFSSNHLEGPLLSLPSSVFYVDLSGNKFSGPISFLCSVRVGVYHLDLSSNQLSGTLPDCWIKFEDLAFLNLANNGLSGTIPHSFGSLRNILALSLSNNSFSGEFPFLRNCTRLTVIDLQKNALSGKIPDWIGESLPNLVILSLQSNKFHGNIPFQLCRLVNIQILDLSSNNITGTIPKCVKNFTALSQERSSNASITNQLTPIVTTEGSFIVESVVCLWLTWKGGEYLYKNTLGLVKSFDLSVNKLDGVVPEEIMSLVGLIALNLSRNNFSGTIPPKIGQLQLLDFLDLSRNQFSGEIPLSLSQINRLSVMDLSNNDLWGKIPTGTQLQSFNAAMYAGNPGLCGLPLPNKCPGEEPAQGPTTTKEDEFITLGFYISLTLGFIAGFWGVCGTLVLSQSRRHAYFNFLANTRDRIYVATMINFAKLKQWFNN
ncbi:hypothetical protein Patl1_22995 [Pistacia atlantica]|uniref:Uncharacterized protein n=1 Tax=Pistacia atlantica TaxID=434234 RepID=A0ACC0ZVJ3_9ROSI|nr:hypothetical protein Patl1_22995 [Pistacia atlantica]